MNNDKLFEVFHTHTGTIFVDRIRHLEYLSVGDYGKENNIKANFLGLKKEINGVKNIDVDLSKKWVATISSQKGCSMKCRFCDCPKVVFMGNASYGDLEYQIETMLEYYCVKYPKTDRFNVHYARMGEPTFNMRILDFTSYRIRDLVKEYIEAKTVHPVVSTMLPKENYNLKFFIKDWCDIKNVDYKGEAGLQFSINSTDDDQRDYQFNGKSMNLNNIAHLADELPYPVGRKYTLNFAVTKDTILDADVLTNLFDKKKFIVKITPIHQTQSAVKNGFDVGEEYEDYNVYRKFEDPLLEKGWDVIVFVPSIEEDSDRITCGNALISR